MNKKIDFKDTSIVERSFKVMAAYRGRQWLGELTLYSTKDKEYTFVTINMQTGNAMLFTADQLEAIAAKLRELTKENNHE